MINLDNLNFYSEKSLYKKPQILLTFDVEEFDIPNEYGYRITLEEQMEVGKRGLDAITKILEDENILCTLFVTANYAKHFPMDILRLSKKHEIASHSLNHSSFKSEDLINSRKILEEITLKKVIGLRIPRMNRINPLAVKEAGYKYDSSVNPTWIPGKYDNRNMPRTIYQEHGIIEIPASVSPNLRLPLFWLSFKNLPYFWYRQMVIQSLKKDRYLCLYFHPWEFTIIDNYNLPFLVRRNMGTTLLDRLKLLISDIKPLGEFNSISSFLGFRI